MTSDERATTVYRAVAPDLLAYFRRRVGDDDAADLLAETMVTAWRRIAVLPQDDEQARRWLFGIAHHVLLNQRRGRVRQTRLAERLKAELATSAPAPPSGDDVRDAIARLEPEQAELVRLVHWEGFALVEVAEIMGIPASTARGRYQRAKDQLRASLTPAEDSRA